MQQMGDLQPTRARKVDLDSGCRRTTGAATATATAAGRSIDSTRGRRLGGW